MSDKGWYGLIIGYGYVWLEIGLLIDYVIIRIEWWWWMCKEEVCGDYKGRMDSV